jgi:hypothetical protein
MQVRVYHSQRLRRAHPIVTADYLKLQLAIWQVAARHLLSSIAVFDL